MDNTRNDINTGGLWDRVSGNWKQFSGEVKRQWGQLTDDDMLELEGDRDKLVGKLQDRYGYAKDQANREIDNWANTLKF